MSIDSQRHDERGATAVEYGLIVAIVVVFIIGSVTFFGAQVIALFGLACGTISPFNC
jgi:pilus assembly protein Flp/PilA